MFLFQPHYSNKPTNLASKSFKKNGQWDVSISSLLLKFYPQIKWIFWKKWGRETRKLSPSSIKQWMKVLFRRSQAQPSLTKLERYYKIHIKELIRYEKFIFKLLEENLKEFESISDSLFKKWLKCKIIFIQLKKYFYL